MAKIAAMPSMAVIDGFRGYLDFYQWCDLVIVRKWPRTNRDSLTPATIAAQKPFAYLNQQLPSLPAEVRESWEWLADQSNLTWRDWANRAYIGGTLAAPGLPPV